MPQLTVKQIKTIRQYAGDMDSANYEVKSWQIQEDYDTAESDIPKTVVFVLRRRLGMAAKWTDFSNESGNDQRSQRWEHLKNLLEYWQDQAGMSGGVLQEGALDLDLDTDIDDIPTSS